MLSFRLYSVWLYWISKTTRNYPTKPTKIRHLYLIIRSVVQTHRLHCIPTHHWINSFIVISRLHKSITFPFYFVRFSGFNFLHFSYLSELLLSLLLLRLRLSLVLISFDFRSRFLSSFLAQLFGSLYLLDLLLRLLLCSSFRLSPCRLRSLLVDDCRDVDRKIDRLVVSSISGLSDQRQFRFFVADVASSSSQL